MLYKIIHGYLHVRTTTTRSPQKNLQPTTRTDAYKLLFFSSAMKLWNNLPNDAVHAESIELKNSLANVRSIN